MKLRYFHMFSGSDNYLVLPLNSVAIENLDMVRGCAAGKDLISSMHFDKTREAEFRVYSKKEHRFLDAVWTAPANFQVHMIQAFEDPDDPNIIHLDTLVAGSGDAISEYYYDVSSQN